MKTNLTMKAAQYNEYGTPANVLKIVETAKPQASTGQIVVKVYAASVNSSDWKRMGKLYEEVTFPSGIGVEASGIVVEIGEGVENVSIGDAVFGYGINTMAEYAVLMAWVKKPDAVPFEVAGALSVVSETAWRCLDDLGLGSGSTILVSGASGGIGSAVIQLARNRGMKVIGTCSEHNFDYIRELGAIPTTYGPGLKDRVKALVPDRIDGALDIAGSKIIPELIEITGDASHVVSVADFSAKEYGARFSYGPPRNIQYVLTEVANLYMKGLYQLHIQEIFPLEETAKAQEISSHKHVSGKLVIVNK